MELIQISTLLNDAIVPNMLGEDTTIAEDLSNVVELGTAIDDLTGEEVENFAKNLLVGVARNIFDTRKYRSETYGLMNDSREYGGVIQRVKAKLLDTVDSHIWTLENGVDYWDGKYYGIETDVKVYHKDSAFKIPNSIPVEMFKQYFTSADGVSNLISMIETTVDNTITLNLNGLARTTLQQLGSSIASTRSIDLLTIWNTNNPSATLSADEALHNASFLRWTAQQIIRLRNLTRDYNKKYNDGTIQTFTPESDLRVTLLDEFASSIMFNMESDTFHNDLVSVGEYNTINFWQNSSSDLLPSLGETAEIVTKIGEGEPTTISNVVGMIYDRYSAGLTARLSKVTATYVGSEDFTTYFHHIANSRFIDTRNTAILLRLA